ncbi:MAG: DUF11 domain-containing protein [Anaerolineales bacterium]|nr:DUF11 domain-containing protein [Anaerolineales bacterium]
MKAGDNRRDLILLMLILLIGILFMIFAGQAALNTEDVWYVQADVGSNINLTESYSADKLSFAPVKANIMTPEEWYESFLTPGEGAPEAETVPTIDAGTTLTPAPTAPGTPTQVIQTTIPSPTAVINPTNTPVIIIPKPTSQPPKTSVDLRITNDDGSGAYTVGDTVVYTVIASNNGPNPITGATITDALPSQVTQWDWACTALVSASGCDPVAGSASNFSDTVNIHSGGSIQYTVTAYTNPAATSNLTHTAVISFPSSYTDPNPGDNTAADTDTPVFSSDLGVTLTDNATDYVPGNTTRYVLTVTNYGPSNVTGAAITDNRPALISLWGWCVAPCTAVPNTTGNLMDTFNLASGASRTYYIAANIDGAALVDLVNTASSSAATDPAAGNDSDSDTDTIITSNTLPNGDIGTNKDNLTDTVPTGGSITLTLGTSITVTGADLGNPDLVYYELPSGPGIAMDEVVLEISDGYNWYTILNWGDGNADAYTNIAIPLAVPPNATTCSGEPDNCNIDATLLYNSNGVAIDLDYLVPPGTYYYVRVNAPSGDSGDGCDVDALYVIP